MPELTWDNLTAPPGQPNLVAGCQEYFAQGLPELHVLSDLAY